LDEDLSSDVLSPSPLSEQQSHIQMPRDQLIRRASHKHYSFSEPLKALDANRSRPAAGSVLPTVNKDLMFKLESKGM